MRRLLPFALVACLLPLSSGSALETLAEPGSTIPDPTAALEVLPANDLVTDCLGAVAAETPVQRGERLTNAMAYVRTAYPDLDAAGVLESAQILLAERCHPDFQAISARKEVLDGHEVVHFGEHSIVHDLYQNGVDGGTVPISLVFFGGMSLTDTAWIRDTIKASGWQEPMEGPCEGGEQNTHVYDQRHGGSDSYLPNQWHLQKVEDEGCFDERHHLHLWPSAKGDNHPGTTYGGYIIANGHYETWNNGHVPQCYDCARNYVTRDMLTAGLVDAVYKVFVDNGKPMTAEPNPDGMVFYLHMTTPARPCPTTQTANDFPIVRIFENVNYSGQCRGFNTDDPDLRNNYFANGATVHDAASSAIVTQGYRAVLYENEATTDVNGMGHLYLGNQRRSTCSDNQFVQGGFNDKASALQIQKIYVTNCYGSFSNVRGSQNWVDATLSSTWNAQRVQARSYSAGAWGAWVPLEKQSWGSWTPGALGPPFSASSGSIVQLRAMVGDGSGVDVSACYQWLPPPGANANMVYCPNPFKATFSGVSGNEWWAQTTVTSNPYPNTAMPIDEVWMRVNCASPGYKMTDQGWGWTISTVQIPSGSRVDFYAISENYETVPNDGGTARYRLAEVDVSNTFSWPSATPTTLC